MREQGRAIEITEFQGLVSNRGRFPAKPGEAKVQTNLRAEPGELSVRKDPVLISYLYNIVGPAANDNYTVMQAWTSRDGHTFLVCQTDDFKIYGFEVE